MILLKYVYYEVYHIKDEDSAKIIMVKKITIIY